MEDGCCKPAGPVDQDHPNWIAWFTVAREHEAEGKKVVPFSGSAEVEIIEEDNGDLQTDGR